MSVVGIDFGNLQSVIAVARNRGIDVITNEVSNRTTPTMVGFGQKQRYLGESAKTLESSNLKNTVCSLQRLIGRKYQDEEITKVEAQFLNSTLVDVNGTLGVEVQYLGETQKFTITQVVAMYLTKLKDTAAKELKAPVSDCVISIPGYFTEVQRRALLDAAEIAGLHCLRLINENTAAALGYGIVKSDLSEADHSNVAFVNMGNASFSVSIVSFLKGKLTVKSYAYDRNLGGRDFDEVLVNMGVGFAKEKYKMDIRSSPKALFRLRTQCEKIKKVLSANPETVLNVEAVMNDIDLRMALKREDFVANSSHILDRMDAVFEKALKDSGLSIDDISQIELVGGATRIPAVKEKISTFFNKSISTTLNQDEAVARGCAFQCAMLSPAFKVRDFVIQELIPHTVSLKWEQDASMTDDDTQVEVFKKGGIYPATKLVTLYRKEDFVIEAFYSKPEELASGVGQWIGYYTVKGFNHPENDDAIIKLKVRINVHGIFTVEQAYTVEEEEKPVEEPTPMETDNAPKEENSDSKPSSADSAKESNEEKPVATKKVVKKVACTVLPGTPSLDTDRLKELMKREDELRNIDRIVIATAESKNSVEEYVYDTRNKLDCQWSEFIHDNDKSQFKALLNDTEDWLYGDGEEASREIYISKLEELKKLGDPVYERFRESELRPKAELEFRSSAQMMLNQALSNDPKYSHISNEDKEKVVKDINSKLSWLDGKMSKQSLIAKYEAPVIFAREMEMEKQSLITRVMQILNKPPPPPPKEEPKPEEKTNNVPNAEEANKNSGQDKPVEPASKDEETMELD